MGLWTRRKRGNGDTSDGRGDTHTASNYTTNGTKSSNHGKAGPLLSSSLPASYKARQRNVEAALPALPVDSEKGNIAKTGEHYYQKHATVPSPAMYIKENRSNGAGGEFGQLDLPSPRAYQNGGAASTTLLPPPVQQRSVSNQARPAFLVVGGASNSINGNASQTFIKPLPPIQVHASSTDKSATVASERQQRLARRASTGSAPLRDNGLPIEELQLCYGYWPIETQRELSLSQIEEIVRLCGKEIRSRGIEEPLLFSSRALDISMDGICSLIRSYFASKDLWQKDLRFANPHDLSGLIKWALGRHINPQGTRGFLTWDMYERWRLGEREKHFPPRYVTTHLLYLLPTLSADLLTTLLDLMSCAVAYTTKNGCTPRKLATLFSSFIFGLPDDGTFEQTYTAFNRFSHATEHLLLAFIRDQSAQHMAASAPSPIPMRLQEVVKDYPACLPKNLNKPPNGATLQPVIRIRRHVRFYSKNLINTAGTWQVPRSTNWASVAPFPFSKSSATEVTPAPFVYTSEYRHLLNIRNFAEDDEDDGLQKFGTLVEKEWSAFMHTGFAPPDASKLAFDLTESERANRQRVQQNLDWDTFSGSGFTGLPDSHLAFDPTVNDSLSRGGLLSAEHIQDLAAKARSIEKALPPFNYDITPREEQSIQVDKQFFEVFSDVLCSSGWTRDEMKESNWALIQFRTRPKDLSRPPSMGSDGRSEDTWFLVEEGVPTEYRAALLEYSQQKPKSSRRISFLRSVRKKTSKPPPMPGQTNLPAGVLSDDVFNRSKSSLASSIPYRHYDSSVATPNSSSRQVDDSVFAPGPGPTKWVTLTKSFSSAGLSHATSIPEEDSETLDEDVPPSPSTVRHSDAGHSISSQHKAAHRGIGIGFTKSKRDSRDGSTGAGLLNLIRRGTTRRQRNTSLGSGEAILQSNTSSNGNLHSPTTTVESSLSPGFNVYEHGVAGPGVGMEVATGPSKHPYLRAPASYTGTTHTFQTQGTAGHSDVNTVREPSPNVAASAHSYPDSTTEGEVYQTPASASTARLEFEEHGNGQAVNGERELPPPPIAKDLGVPDVPDTGAADQMVDVDERAADAHSVDPRQSIYSGDHYGGIAEDGNTSVGHAQTVHPTEAEPSPTSMLSPSSAQYQQVSHVHPPGSSSIATESQTSADGSHVPFMHQPSGADLDLHHETDAPPAPVQKDTPLHPRSASDSTRRVSRLVTPNGTRVADLISKYGGNNARVTS